jgi:hypothetical protein
MVVLNGKHGCVEIVLILQPEINSYGATIQVALLYFIILSYEVEYVCSN